LKILQIISSKPKAGRRGAGRRSSARAQVLGKPVVTPAQRARAAATPATDAAKAVAQGSEKIIVSNLPGDVNEAQVKVCDFFLLFFFLLSNFHRL
jgi:THO complex subunit 4